MDCLIRSLNGLFTDRGLAVRIEAHRILYRKSGVMTFIIDQGGLALQKDSAADTANIAKAIDAFDPDDTWQRSSNFGHKPLRINRSGVPT